ncbi:MAG: hypothetical protein COX77_03195 [Candidatus Komeilibacteria bacterium CG_4_10_14_0_2_um_filter_37_10]|uniref:DUF3566 domain-containing protein n=1 Tax=Candidatus Komeilibacteria bacterium CG_4_10_14_0_2_um_filter_37_10 TaxID=1974470 RepID=A0A2M7VEE9_9BACT|nr:MAG: hypothetical protein COX77_03195 [Candidatus Komeilibacteria bacterium CG_4_10_14_0_2_um_filter_37_10]
MKEILKIDAISLAKVLAVITGGVYLVVGVIINIGVLFFGLGSMSSLDFLGFGSGLIATVLVSIVVGLFSFFLGILMGFIYNLVANYFGGVIVLFEDRSVVEQRLREAKAAKMALQEEKKRLKLEREKLEQDTGKKDN